MHIKWAASWENQQFAYAKTKAQISFAVTAKLISAFVFATRIVQFLFSLNRKFQASSSFLWLYSPVCVGPVQKPYCWFSHEAAQIFAIYCIIFQHCHNVTVIDRLPNTGELLLEKIASYLNEDIPVIVENATESWPNRGIINAMDLKKVRDLSQEKQSWRFSTRSDTNQPLQSKKKARCWKSWV